MDFQDLLQKKNVKLSFKNTTFRNDFYYSIILDILS